MTIWDEPVFKFLSKNDTPAAKGHQGGIVIPKDLEDFFPDPHGLITRDTPTADVQVDADLIVGGQAIGRAQPRYQHQTWGGTRSPERRLTAELGPLLMHASTDDVLLFCRAMDDPSRMRIELIRKTDPQYFDLVKLAAGERWGVLEARPVLSNSAVRELLDQQDLTSGSVFEPGRGVRQDSREVRLRDAAFRRNVIEIYGGTCAISGEGVMAPSGVYGVDAAHIIPVSLDGSDHPTNGLALRKDLHWAFDRGMFQITVDRHVRVLPEVMEMGRNLPLAHWDGVELRAPNPVELAPAKEALAWRLDHFG